ncbi:energy transducer TonB [Hymenobacter sp. DG25B]|jgi:protein TonB|uniref:energy transducer TonB n=1 Tax=Hymenobacter sp. DG25B TaxID=1385664 RepID=UPI0009E23547|nr:energy transducer TonB [Hymenobacter sp. DG25B]
MNRSTILLLLLLCFVGKLRAQKSKQMVTLATNTPLAPPEEAAQPAAAPVVYLLADQMPTFTGGEAGFQQFIRDKAQYPEKALAQGISGKVHVRFVVDDKGRIRDAQVIKGLGYGLDEEALRLVRIMPWWTPGTIKGKAVWVSYTMPITFRAMN